MVSIITGLPSVVVQDIAKGEQSFGDFWAIEQFPNELLAAARMVGSPIDSREIRIILGGVRLCARVDTPELDSMSSELGDAPFSVGLEPYNQGYEAARWLRGRLGLGHEHVSVRKLLKSFRVAFQSIEVSNVIDAIACWGPRHGPAVILNRLGRHNQSRAGRRATLAHELAHLLLDRRDALPFAEVLGGRVSKDLEERARAFAAELLVPQRVIADSVASGAPVREMVELLSVQYDVSREVLAWQTRNSRVALTSADYWYLKSLVRSHPERF